MPGKRTKTAKNYGANASFKERSRMARASDLIAQTSQEMFRRSCLKQRIAEGRITEKNKKEMTTLRMPGVDVAAKYPGLDR